MDQYFGKVMMSKHLYSRKWEGDKFIIGMSELLSHLEYILKASLVNDKQEKIAIGKIVNVMNKKVR